MTEYDLYDAAEIIYSKRKTSTIQIKLDGTLVLRVPNHMTKPRILKLLREKKDWILTHTEKAAARNEILAGMQPLTSEELTELSARMKAVLPSKLSFYARQLSVTYYRVTIRAQKTRWGSCSSDGNLNFNCLLMLAPDDVLDYVIVHELSHRLEMNHSKAFWSHVESVLPDYKIQKKWLKDHGAEILGRLYN